MNMTRALFIFSAWMAAALLGCPTSKDSKSSGEIGPEGVVVDYPPPGESATVTVYPSFVEGSVKTGGGSNHSGLSSFASPSILPYLRDIPHTLNRIHFVGETPTETQEQRFPQPEPNVWNLTYLDQVVRLTRRIREGGGPDFILNINNCPTWMTDSGKPGTAPELFGGTYENYTQYCARLVGYYNKGGFVDDDGAIVANPDGIVGIKYWELWNEPDINDFGQENNPVFSPEEFAKFFIVVSSAMRAVDPAILIGGPGTSWKHKPYVDALLASGAQVDFVSFHYYPGGDAVPDDPVFSDFEDDPVPWYKGSIPVYITEVNMSSNPMDPRNRGDLQLVSLPLAYMSAIEHGVARIIRWETLDATYPLLDLNGIPHRSYWAERFFWEAARLGSQKIAHESSSEKVACLATTYSERLSLIVVNRGTARKTDINGLGEKREIKVLGLPAGLYEVRVVDRHTVPLIGPLPTLMHSSGLALSIDGYGMAVVQQVSSDPMYP